MMQTQTTYIEPLTAREQQVAEAVTRWLSNKQVAREFGSVRNRQAAPRIDL